MRTCAYWTKGDRSPGEGGTLHLSVRYMTHSQGRRATGFGRKLRFPAELPTIKLQGLRSTPPAVTGGSRAGYRPSIRPVGLTEVGAPRDQVEFIN
jgi:hypothetical protein